MSAWQERLSLLAGGGLVAAKPLWHSRAPLCSEGECPYFDGKRCELLGHRPGDHCAPVIRQMGDVVARAWAREVKP